MHPEYELPPEEGLQCPEKAVAAERWPRQVDLQAMCCACATCLLILCHC